MIRRINGVDVDDEAPLMKRRAMRVVWTKKMELGKCDTVGVSGFCC